MPAEAYEIVIQRPYACSSESTSRQRSNSTDRSADATADASRHGGAVRSTGSGIRPRLLSEPILQRAESAIRQELRGEPVGAGERAALPNARAVEQRPAGIDDPTNHERNAPRDESEQAAASEDAAERASRSRAVAAAKYTVESSRSAEHAAAKHEPASK